MWKTLRDVLIVIADLVLAGYEIVYGGGRAAVLTFLAAIILSPVAIRVDEKEKVVQKIKQQLGNRKNDSDSNQ